VTDRQTRLGQGLILVLGLFAFATILAFHNITDNDLWAKLAIGASLLDAGRFMRHDLFAFTPTLPLYIDHEWGAGVIFYGVLRMFGPPGLMALKIGLALGALAFGMATGRKQGTSLNVLLLMALPCAACLMPGYIPVVRCHAFTYFFFGTTLFCLEELRDSRSWPAIALPLIMMVWANVHGGFVVGLGIVFLYAGFALILRQRAPIMIGTAAACAAITFVNPYGYRFWQYLIPALLNPRARITEWQPLPMLAWDDFWGFRLLFGLTVIAVAFSWKSVSRKNFQGLAVMALVAIMGWRNRRHGSFFGVAALAFAGPYFESIFVRTASALRMKLNPVAALGILYLGLAFFVAVKILPGASLQPLAPMGEDPVREADILSLAHAKGNLATPFGWGSYLTWRLFPNIKISMDGRYETTYPESTFVLNNDFYDNTHDPFKLCRDYKVDFVVLDLMRERLRPEDLAPLGYVVIWKDEGVSALLCLPEHAAALRDAVAHLPPFTIDPLRLRFNVARE
jgi:hypothetical protein